MGPTSQGIVTDLVKRYKGADKGRKNELTIAAKLAISFIADRIDKGADVETTLLLEQETEEQTDTDDGPAS